MSGLDKIISRLENECEESCKAIALTAEQACESERVRSEAEAEKKAADIIKAAEKEADGIVRKAHSQAGIEAGRATLEAKLELIGDIVDEAKKKLVSLEVNEYFELLSRLIKKNARTGNGILCLSENDLQRLPSWFAEKLDAGIEIASKPENIADGFILKYGDIEINCTFNAMFSAAGDELKATAGEILFG